MLGVPDRREESLNEHELMNPSVSIVVNTLNRAEALRDLLNALAHQRYDNFEVVVVNGPSTDHTEAVIREFGDLVKARTCPPRQSVNVEKHRDSSHGGRDRCLHR